ncbi:MAG: hypothetical protein BWK75_03720 [Candidatus Altiarchaeales archaeon A3]|nr:MAG: hypothetical protein BWK75_03720 [Candidatus Altiarchaeales archaeon A3]
MGTKSRMVPDIVKVGNKGQLVIPTKLREVIINEDSVFVVSHPKKDLLLLKKIESSTLHDDVATLKEAGLTQFTL